MQGKTYTYVNWSDFEVGSVQFAVTQDRQNKNKIVPTYGGAHRDIAIVTPACVTNWPRINGDGNFGTMWGPAEVENAKYTLDLTDSAINEVPNEEFALFAKKMEELDEKFLDYMQSNQLRLLGRKNLSRDELKILQIRSIRTKYDKLTGAMVGYSMNLSVPRCSYDLRGSRTQRQIPICDSSNNIVEGGVVSPGDVVCALARISSAYVIGDKFGLHWAFDTIKVVCQQSTLQPPTSVPAFGVQAYSFAAPYEEQQSSSEMITA